MQLQHQIPLKEKWVWPWARGAFQNLGFPLNIYTMAETSEFKFGTQLSVAKEHHKVTPIGKNGHGLALMDLSKIMSFHFYIYTMAETWDFKYGTQLGFAKAHHKATPRGKVSVTLG